MRDVYLPADVRGTPPLVPEGTDLAVWKYERQGVPYAIAFAGKQSKPLWHHRFRNEADRQRTIDQEVEGRRRHQQRKQERTDERKNFQHGLMKGSILSSSWGYDQTNVDFYEVTEVVGKSVLLRKIGSKEAPGHSHVVPVPGHFVGPPIRKLPQGSAGHVYVKISGHNSAYLWDGKPQYVTPWGSGH
jgi:hypothetical protein